MANSTRISKPIKTIAWPSCSFRWGDLVRVLSTVDRIRGDDDSVADNLLDQGSERLKVKPEGHLDRLIADRWGDGVAAWTWRGKRAEAATRPVRRAVAGRAGIGDEDPPGVGGRHLR